MTEEVKPTVDTTGEELVAGVAFADFDASLLLLEVEVATFLFFDREGLALRFLLLLLTVDAGVVSVVAGGASFVEASSSL